MNTLDLFSGIGGITYALRGGIVDTIKYCEIDPFARVVLENNMRKGKIPKADIAGDVRFLTSKNIDHPVDMIVAGFPCVGMSSVGLRKGFEDKQSGLFSEILRLTDELSPDFLFLENVPGIIKNGMKHVVTELHYNRRYELVWTTVGAYQVGAPHIRNRWFMLAKKPKAKKMLTVESYKPYDWSEEPVERMSIDCKKEHILRCSSMGNSVCPDAVRLAFIILSSGFTETTIHCKRFNIKSLKANEDMQPISNPCKDKNDEFPKHGCVLAESSKKNWGKMYKFSCPIDSIKPNLNLTIIPPQITKKQKANPMITTTILRKPVKLAHWSTPRYSMTQYANVLTERTIIDLPSQIRYEKSTPKSLRKGHVNGEFLEWMMGYPIGFTKPW
jgi:DNA (cytosine-5)-methyltransferase 1